MIQRIQSVYLLISTILIGLLFLLPFAEIAKDGAIYLFNFKGVLLDGVVKTNGLAVPILLVMIIALNVLAIFSYSNRGKQIKLVWGAMLMLVVLLVLFVYFTYLSFSGAQISFKLGAVLPLISIILNYLAIRAINKDDALIRSIDRIR
jgi:hypothetical protein